MNIFLKALNMIYLLNTLQVDLDQLSISRLKREQRLVEMVT